jgi:hypothetical protein
LLRAADCAFFTLRFAVWVCLVVAIPGTYPSFCLPHPTPDHG